MSLVPLIKIKKWSVSLNIINKYDSLSQDKMVGCWSIDSIVRPLGHQTKKRTSKTSQHGRVLLKSRRIFIHYCSVDY